MNKKRVVVIACFVVVILLTLSVVSAKENMRGSASDYCTEYLGGVYDGANSLCINAKIETERCPDGYATYFLGGEARFVPLHGAKFSLSRFHMDYTCGYVSFADLEGQGVCKFFDIEGGHVGGTIKASGLGSPSFLRLKVGNKIYKLPVIESTIVRDDTTAKWTAEFATVDPKTGQPLVPEGDYEVGCFGMNGTASGGGMDVTITR